MLDVLLPMQPVHDHGLLERKTSSQLKLTELNAEAR